MGDVFTLVPSGVVAGAAEGDPCVGSSSPGDPSQPWGSASGRRQMPNERSPGQQVKRERAERGGAGQAGVCGRDLGHLGEVGRGEVEAAAEASVAGAEGLGAGGPEGSGQRRDPCRLESRPSPQAWVGATGTLGGGVRSGEMVLAGVGGAMGRRG